MPMPSLVHSALLRQRSSQDEARELAGPHWEDEIPGLVFTTALGRPRCGTALTHTFHRLLAGAGVRQRTSIPCATRRPPSCWRAAST
jgi:hypothetical protein